MDYRLFTDDMLVKLLRGGDEDALKEIYTRYVKGCFDHALRKIRIHEVAQELVQNLFVSLWEKKANCQIAHLESYLHAALKYQIISYIRTKIVREKYLRMAESETVVSEANETESTLLIRELSQAIETTIALLPEKSQLIFRLSRFEHRTNKEISRSMDISEKAVEYHITQSLKLLKTHLKDFIFLFL
jgi:RNA polymerase sigma-70 factor (family 1)